MTDTNLHGLETELNELKEETLLSPTSRDRMKELTSSVNEVWSRLTALTQHAVIYARAQPADKMTLVRLYQRNGDVCAMTGDGGRCMICTVL